jgi:hypothetical protein
MTLNLVVTRDDLGVAGWGKLAAPFTVVQGLWMSRGLLRSRRRRWRRDRSGDIGSIAYYDRLLVAWFGLRMTT